MKALFLITIVSVFSGMSLAHDLEADVLSVESRESGSTLPPYTAWAETRIPQGESVQEAIPLLGRVDFKWWRFKGPEHMVGCIFTADKKDGKLVNIGGGRNCGGKRDSSCGYIAEGWQAWGIAGRDCAGFGIPVCGGPFCY